jgi:hypothetical protein
VVVGSPFHEWYAAPAKDGNCCALVNCHLIEEEEEKNFFLKKKEVDYQQRKETHRARYRLARAGHKPPTTGHLQVFLIKLFFSFFFSSCVAVYFSRLDSRHYIRLNLFFFNKKTKKTATATFTFRSASFFLTVSRIVFGYREIF